MMLRLILSNKYLILGLRIVLGAVFIYASIDKIQNPQAFAEAIYNYRMMPHETINLMAIVMPWLELISGIFIVVGFLTRGSVLMIGFLLIVFIIAISSALARGLDISCGCFTLEGEADPVAVETLVRDLFLLAACGIVYFFGKDEIVLRRAH